METELRKTIKELMGQLERKEKLDEQKLAFVLAELAKASHDGPCPCGSGRKFGDCCKLDWVILRDQPRVATEADVARLNEEMQSGKLPKGNGEDKDPGGEEIKWMIHLGTSPDGMVIRSDKGAQGLPQIQLAEMLLTAYHIVNYQATVNDIRQSPQRQTPRVPGPGMRSAFGN